MQVSTNTDLCPADVGPFSKLDKGLTQLCTTGKKQTRSTYFYSVEFPVI